MLLTNLLDWIQVSSSGMAIQSSQVVMGFQPYNSNSHMTERLVSELSSQHIKVCSPVSLTDTTSQQ